ncbi:hypothetical protein ACFLYW_02765 [Thermodesulfobacteriota bacterium]
MMTKTLLDASSAILLFKVGLLHELTGFYRVHVTRSVFLELSRQNYPGADVFLNAVSNDMIKVIDVVDIPAGDITPVDALYSLDQGERDTIKCFKAGGMDLIITDDGRAARYCKENKLPFINALLFPRLLYFAGCISWEESTMKMDDIIDFGRHAPQIIEWARNCRKETLAFAIPLLDAHLEFIRG